jgi:DNA-binding NtrC family response regulator
MNLISVVLPALDMRRADIKPYSERWLNKVCDAVDVDLPSISDKEWTRLFHHEYAGGYDELNAILMRSLINGSSGKFQFELSASQTAEKKARSTRDSIDGSITLSNGATYDEHMREYLEQMMIRHGWKIYGSDGAAVQLGMKPTTLQSKLEKYSVRKR